MQPSLEEEISELRDRFWSDRDPEGRAFVPLADAYRRAGELDEAVELLEDGLDRHPDLTAGHLVAGRVHRARDDAGAARRALRRVLELDPENAEALRSLAELAEEAGRDAEARTHWHRLALREPDGDARAHLRRLKEEHFGDLLEDGEEEPGEVVSIDELAPDAPAADTGAGEPAGIGAGEPTPDPAAGPPATDDLPEPPEEGDNAAVYTRTMAELYVRQGLWDRAEEVYEHLLEADPSDEELRARLDAVRARRGPGETAEAERGPPDPLAERAERAETGAEDEGAEVETLARDWASGPAETGELDSPFAWGGDEGREGTAEAGSAARASGPSIAAYFRRLVGEGDVGEEAGAEDGPTGESGGSDPTGSERRSEDFRRWLEGLE